MSINLLLEMVKPIFSRFGPVATVILGLGACAPSSPDLPVTLGPAPVPSPLYAELKNDAGGDAVSAYGSFAAASIAQADAMHRLAANHLVTALAQDPTSQLLAQRAFQGLLYAGRVQEAARLAAAQRSSAAGSSPIDQDDLSRLVELVVIAETEDWSALNDVLDETKPQSFLNLFVPLMQAWSAAAQGDKATALSAIDALSLNQQLAPIAIEQRAYLLDFMGDTDAAERAYENVLAAPLGSLQPVISYASFLMRQQRVDKARSVLRREYKRFDSSDFLLREGAKVLAGLRASRLAATPQGALSLVFYRLGSEFQRSDARQAAVVYLRLAAYLDPLAGDVLTMLGGVFEAGDDHSAAAEVYLAVPQVSSFYRLARIRRINALERAGRQDEAWVLVSDALREEPENRTMLIAAGDLKRSAGECPAAIDFYDRAVATITEPGLSDWFVYFARGVCHEQIGTWLAAESDMTRALEIKSDEPSVLNYLGYSWIDRGINITAAKDMITRAASARPDDGFIVDSLGWVHYLTGDFDLAVEHLEEAVRLEPDDATINHHLGDAYWQVGRRLEARFQWRRALVSTKDKEDRETLMTKLETGLPAVADARSPATGGPAAL